MSVLKAVQDVTDRIAARSADTRRDYLNRLDAARAKGVYRAPNAVPNPSLVTIRATSVADPGKSANAAVTISR